MKKNRTLLLVEDNAIIALDLRLTLEDFGYRVLLAASGEQAVEVARRDPPDGVVMDINLLGSMDGLEAAFIIRRERVVPVVFVSGYDSDMLRDRAAEFEQSAYLLKPVSAEDVRAALESLAQPSEAGRGTGSPDLT